MNRNFDSLISPIKPVYCFLISGISIGLLSGLVSLPFQEKVWEGSFVIRVKDEQAGNKPGFVSPFLSSTTDEQVLILGTPYVLGDAYSKYKSTEEANGKTVPPFKKWVSDYISIKSIDKSQVVEVLYRSVEPDSIIPVLKSILDQYTKYSLDSQSESNVSQLARVASTIEQYRQNADRDKLQLLEYKLKYGISDTGTSPSQSSAGAATNNPILKYLSGFERASSSNGSNNLSPKRDSSGSLDEQISKARSIFKPNNPALKRLLRQKNQLLKDSERSFDNLFRNEEIISLNKDQKRGILAEYLNLLTKSQTSDNLYDSLKRVFDENSAKIAIGNTPWKLLQPPTLDPRQLSPRPLRWYFFFSIAGSIISYILYIVYVSQKSLSTREEQIEKLIGDQPLYSFSSLDIKRIEKLNLAFPDHVWVPIEVSKLTSNKVIRYSQILNLSLLDWTSFLGLASQNKSYKCVVIIIELGYSSLSTVRLVVERCILESLRFKCVVVK